MVKLINAVSGGPMWVHESRLEEYLKAGHKLATPPPPRHPLIKEEKPKSSTSTKKTTKGK